MTTAYWLLVYNSILIMGIASVMWLGKSTKKQFASGDLSIGTTIRLIGTLCALVLMCCLVLYVSGVLTYASTR